MDTGLVKAIWAVALPVFDPASVLSKLRALIPVSYTHLDVYKRQDLTSQSHHLILMLTQSSSDRKRSLCHMLQMSTLQPIEVL